MPLTSKELAAASATAWAAIQKPLGLRGEPKQVDGWVWPEAAYDLQEKRWIPWRFPWFLWLFHAFHEIFHGFWTVFVNFHGLSLVFGPSSRCSPAFQSIF